MASASASTRETSVGEISGGADTLTVSAMASAVAVSILSAIDGCGSRKFDGRNREERTSLNLEIDRYDVLTKGHTELRNRDVARILLVGVERGAIGERDRQPRVVRAGRSHDVGANLQARDSVYILERRKTAAMVVLRGRPGVGLVLETHEVQQAHSSSPSISSSATSTTTLWMSMLNHSRKDFRSRIGGHVVSSSVHAPSWNSKIQTALSSTHSWMSSSSSNSGIRQADPYVRARAPRI